MDTKPRKKKTLVCGFTYTIKNKSLVISFFFFVFIALREGRKNCCLLFYLNPNPKIAKNTVFIILNIVFFLVQVAASENRLVYHMI